tara:strand:+ start:25815 stop:26309 length:495 start_codon:yes stop_codon:yes gene_type:complete
MKKSIYLLISLILLSSCYTQKTAQRDVSKANIKFPIVTSEFCSKTFPVKESVKETVKFIKGETIIKKDTITVDCDSVVSDKTKSNKVLIRYQNIYKTDTIVKEIIIEKENTAKVTNLELQIKSRDKIIEDKDEVIEDKNQNIKLLKYFLIASILVALGLIFIKK